MELTNFMVFDLGIFKNNVTKPVSFTTGYSAVLGHFSKISNNTPFLSFIVLLDDDFLTQNRISMYTAYYIIL